MINATHLYNVKSGTKKLNGASQLIIQHCNSTSPPIPTSSMPERAFPNRRVKRDQRPNSPDTILLGELGRNDSSRTSLSSFRNSGSSTARSARSVNNPKLIKSTKFRGLRPRASTLPSLVTSSTTLPREDVPRDSFSDSFSNEYPYNISRQGDFDDDDNDDDGTMTEEDINDEYDDFDDQPFDGEGPYDEDDIYGTDSDDDIHLEYHEPPDLRSQFFLHHNPANNSLELIDDSTNSVDDPTLSSENDDEEDEVEESVLRETLLSEEDDSDMEEELEFAVRQIKQQMPEALNGQDEAIDSQPPSTLTSPKAVSRLDNSNARQYFSRQSSFDTPLGSGIAKSPRRVSVPTKAHSLRKASAQPNGTSISEKRLTPEFLSSIAALRRPTDPLQHANLAGYYPTAGSNGYSEKVDFGLDITAPSMTNTNKRQVERTTSIQSNVFKKQSPTDANQTLPLSSLLTSQIKAKQAGAENPLEEYIFAAGKAERAPLKLKMYMPSSDQPRKPWQVIVRTDVNVSNAIGFALYCYMEEKRTPELKPDMCNANKWTLRIVEDDGEPDEDFPALDRTRMLSAYKFDEFALVEATPEQVIENEKITPSIRKKVVSKPEVNKPAVQTSVENGQPEKVTLRVYQYPFDDMLSAVYWTDEVNVKTSIDEILYQICVDKNLEQDQYVCKIAGRRKIIPRGANIQSLDGMYNLELTPRRIVNKMNGYAVLLSDLPPIKKIKSANAAVSQPAAIPSSPPPISGGLRSSLSLKRTSATFTGAIKFRVSTEDERSGSRLSFTGRPSTSSTSSVPPTKATHHSTSAAAHARVASNARASMLVPPLLPDSLTAIGFQKYKIWRRQPMSFMQRHERVLALDGEYVHIMPSDDRAWYDYSPKTSSFHISQMTKCKQSRKIPTNFKIVIMKATGVSKRYDLEALEPATTQDIVAKLKGLHNSYLMKKDSSRRH